MRHATKMIKNGNAKKIKWNKNYLNEKKWEQEMRRRKKREWKSIRFQFPPENWRTASAATGSCWLCLQPIIIDIGSLCRLPMLYHCVARPWTYTRKFFYPFLVCSRNPHFFLLSFLYNFDANTKKDRETKFNITVIGAAKTAPSIISSEKKENMRWLNSIYQNPHRIQPGVTNILKI